MDKDELLRSARTMIKDLVNGWPVRELHMPPDKLIQAIDEAIGKENT